jgi:hypothetical protein
LHTADDDGYERQAIDEVVDSRAFLAVAADFDPTALDRYVAATAIGDRRAIAAPLGLRRNSR